MIVTAYENSIRKLLKKKRINDVQRFYEKNPTKTMYNQLIVMKILKMH